MTLVQCWILNDRPVIPRNNYLHLRTNYAFFIARNINVICISDYISWKSIYVACVNLIYFFQTEAWNWTQAKVTSKEHHHELSKSSRWSPTFRLDISNSILDLNFVYISLLFLDIHLPAQCVSYINFFNAYHCHHYHWRRHHHHHHPYYCHYYSYYFIFAW